METRKIVREIPADDVWFDLEVDNDINPMDVVTSGGFNARGWEYLGPQLSGKRTLQVKLVHLGYVRNLEEARKRADEKGHRLVEGQAQEPFKTKFPKPDGKEPIIFGGSEWWIPEGGAYAPYLYEFKVGWKLPFRSSDDNFPNFWRWLIANK